MNMNTVFKFLELCQRVTVSYGQLLIIWSAFFGKGIEAFKEAIEVFKQDKYAPVRQNFERGILLLYGAMAEFQKGTSGLLKSVAENPEDFKLGLSLMKELNEDFPKLAKECFNIPDEMVKQLKKDTKDQLFKLPDFIKVSGEYMEHVNVGKREVSVDEFKYMVVDFCVKKPYLLAEILKTTKADVESMGWAKLVLPNETVVLWADSFEMDLPPEIAVTTFREPKWPYNDIGKTEKERMAPAVNLKMPTQINKDSIDLLAEFIDPNKVH